MDRLKDKVAIITGAASGVGKEDATLFADEGAKVVLTDLNEPDGEKAAAAINAKHPGAALFLRHDIAEEADWERVIATTRERFGGLDVLVNNAAILVQASIVETSLDTWRKVQRINSDGYFLGCRHGLLAMQERGGGSIVNMSSLAALGGQSSFCAYSASKGAVAALTRSVAAYCRRELNHIRCNSIHPDGIATPMVFNLHKQKDAKPSYVREKDPKQLQARFAQPRDIANLVLFLAADESRFVNGAEYRIDNGYLMWGD
ncbi:MAG: SDR family oxidoreductase [Nevskiaceae bacterium]|nr:MAG: SDR family oxidoreductase [Nevskiaceae bacterium]TBR71392.1 MAG: SDR family oxidoreductase [Nevskiaceae bacterium]